MIDIRLNWTDFKQLIANKQLITYLQYRVNPKFYIIEVNEQDYHFHAYVYTDGSDNVNKIDFETNFKPNANKKIGTYDFTVDNKLRVESTLAANPADAPGCPVISNNLVVDWDNSEVSLPKKTNPYLSLYSYSGKGKMFGFKIKFNSDDIRVKLEIDNKIIFDIDCEFLDDISEEDREISKIEFLSWDDEARTLNFKPSYPILYTSSINVSARSLNDSTKRKMKNLMINLTKEL